MPRAYTDREQELMLSCDGNLELHTMVELECHMWQCWPIADGYFLLCILRWSVPGSCGERDSNRSMLCPEWYVDIWKLGYMEHFVWCWYTDSYRCQLQCVLWRFLRLSSNERCASSMLPHGWLLDLQ